MSAYNPSFIDKKWTILQQLEAIKKWLYEHENIIIESQFNELVERCNELKIKLNNTKEIAENGLSLAQTNEQDISIIEGDISEINEDIVRLNNKTEKQLSILNTPPSVPQLVGIGINNAQFTKDITIFSPKLYKHEMMCEYPDGTKGYFISLITFDTDSNVHTTYESMFGKVNNFRIPVGGYIKQEGILYNISDVIYVQSLNTWRIHYIVNGVEAVINMEHASTTITDRVTEIV